MMDSIKIKIWNFIKIKYKSFTRNFREIFTSIIEICAAFAIAMGVNINWGKGWGFIVGGTFALIMSFLSSFDPKQFRGNQ